MKKTLCVFLAALFALSCLVCCGGGKADESSDKSVAGVQSATESFEFQSAEDEQPSTAASSEASEESSFAAGGETTEVTSEEMSEEVSEISSKDPSEPICAIPDDLYYEPIDEYFNNSVFIGYSIMMHFGRYVNDWRDRLDYRIMGGAEFRAGVGMSFIGNEQQTPDTPNNALPKHNGIAYNFQDLPAAMGVDTMYIGLTPYADMRTASIDTCVETGAQYAIRGLELIRAKNPNLKIVVLAGTYNTGENVDEALDFRRVNNDNIRAYNNLVLSYCNEAGIDFVDVATPLTNGYGLFVKEWASDGAYHIKQDPYKIWIEVLRNYAAAKQSESWKNAETMPTLGA